MHQISSQEIVRKCNSEARRQKHLGLADPYVRPDWERAPLETFRAWMGELRPVIQHSFRETSFETYQAIFQGWLKFLDQRRTSLFEAGAADIEAFLTERVLEPVSRRRYLQWLDRLYQHLGALEPTLKNPTTYWLMREKPLVTALPEWLTTEELQTLLAHLQQLPGWRGARDRAMASLLLGAGVRVNELVDARWLTKNDQPDWDNLSAPDYTKTLTPAGVHLARDIQLLPGLYRQWWDTWQEMAHIPRHAVIASNKAGKAYTPEGVFLRVATWHPRANPQRLRNTYARLAYAHYQNLATVKLRLGHAETRSTLKLIGDLVPEGEAA